MFTESVLVQIIQTVGIIVAAGVPSIVVLLVNKSRQKSESLNRDLKKALGDIKFLLAVEAEHAKMWREHTGGSNVRIVRNVVHAQDQVYWSGDFSSKRIEQKLKTLD